MPNSESPSSERPPAASSTVSRAIRLLDALAEVPTGMGLSDLSRQCGLDKATTVRLLRSWSQAGYVLKDSHSGRYRLGLKFVEVARRLLDSMDLRTIAQPHLAELAARTGETAVLAVLEGAEVVLLDSVEGGKEVRAVFPTGTRRPVHVSSAGKAILAFLPITQMSAVLASTQFEARTEHSIRDPATFTRQLDNVRAQGWALSRDENVIGSASVSAPVFDHDRRPVGAIGVAAASASLQPDATDAIAQLVVDTARRLSAEIGYRPTGRGPH